MQFPSFESQTTFSISLRKKVPYLLFRFVELQLMWYGGEKGLMSLVGEGKTMR
jgi:hypothetical protein